MELKLIDIQSAQKPLTKIMNSDLPIKIAFRLSRLIQQIDSVYQDIEAQRQRLIEKYGVKTVDTTTVKPEHIDKFKEEFHDFLTNESVVLEIDLIDLETLTGVNLTPLEVLSLAPFLKE